MLQQLDVPYSGELTIHDNPSAAGYYSSTSKDYTMQRGDILFGRDKHAFWNHFPEIYVNGEKIEPQEFRRPIKRVSPRSRVVVGNRVQQAPFFTGAQYQNANVYSAGTAKTATVRYHSVFSDSISREMDLFPFSDLVVDYNELSRLVGYREVNSAEELKLEDGFQINTHSVSCSPRSYEEYFSATPMKSGTTVNYKRSGIDVTTLADLDYTELKKKMITGINHVLDPQGQCTKTSYYSIKAGNTVLQLEDSGCDDDDLQVLLHLLRSS